MVIHYPFFGGPHNQALRLEQVLQRRGVATTVLLPDEPGNAAARLREANVNVVSMPLHRLRARLDLRLQARFVAGFAGDVRRIVRLIRSREIDVVEINGLVNSQAAVAARLAGVPVVWQLLDTRAPAPLRRLLMHAVRRLGDTVMSTGMRVAERHPGALELGERLVPFFPPVDTALFRPPAAAERVRLRESLGIGRDQTVVGTVANLAPQKGLEHFVEAVEQMDRAIPGCRFLLVGRPMESRPALTNDRFGRPRRQPACSMTAGSRWLTRATM